MLRKNMNIWQSLRLIFGRWAQDEEKGERILAMLPSAAVTGCRHCTVGASI